MKKVGYLKNAVARSNGFYSTSGEKLKSQGLTDEFIAEWNGTAKPKPAPKAKKVAEVVKEAPKPKKKSKKKKSTKNKSTLSSMFGGK